MSEKIDKVLEPVVGKFYWVPCAHTHNDAIYPVIPILHKDPDIAPHIGRHYHHDGRFTGRLSTGESFRLDKTNYVVPVEDVKFIKYQIRKCMSRVGGLEGKPGRDQVFKEWADTQIGRRCLGTKCPHKGAQMVLEDGLLVCPMHNLIADPKTQKVVGWKL